MSDKNSKKPVNEFEEVKSKSAKKRIKHQSTTPQTCPSSRPIPVKKPNKKKFIIVESKEYRWPNKIPDKSKEHIQKHHRQQQDNKWSYFVGHLSDDIIASLILETSAHPLFYKVDRSSIKRMYRFLEYDRPIGRHGRDGTDCCWLVVVAKPNSWIITAYPVPAAFVRSSKLPNSNDFILRLQNFTAMPPADKYEIGSYTHDHRLPDSPPSTSRIPGMGEPVDISCKQKSRERKEREMKCSKADDSLDRQVHEQPHSVASPTTSTLHNASNPQEETNIDHERVDRRINETDDCLTNKAEPMANVENHTTDDVYQQGAKYPGTDTSFPKIAAKPSSEGKGGAKKSRRRRKKNIHHR